MSAEPSESSRLTLLPSDCVATDSLVRLQRAQLRTVAYLHFYLPIDPVAWIIRKMDKDFIEVWAKYRPKFSILKVFLVAGVMTWAPYAYGWFFLADHCKAKTFSMTDESNDESHVMLARQGCEFEKWMETRKAQLLVPAAMLALTGFLWLGLCINASILKVQAHQILFLTKSLFPDVFYSGLGRIGGYNRSYRIFVDCHKEPSWSRLHDLFGSQDLVYFCLAVVISMWVTLPVAGLLSVGSDGGAKGITIALLFTGPLCYALNYFFGAGDRLIMLVQGQLRHRQPHMTFLKDVLLHSDTDQEILEKADRAIEDRVQSAIKIITKSAEATNFTQNRRFLKVIQDIRNDGHKPLRAMVQWIVKRRNQFQNLDGVCLHLFNASNTLACSEQSVVAMCLMDTTLFLLAYFEDDMYVTEGLRWDSQYLLQEVHMSEPQRLLFEASRDGFREIPYAENP